MSALLAMVGVGATLTGPAVATAAPRTRPVVAQAQPAALPIRVDAIRDEQWQLDEFNAKALWKVSTGNGVTVAVIDSGVDGSHPDLAGQVLPGLDLVQPGGNGQTDPVGHGTTVAGLIAGRNDDTRGVAGLAPKAKILPVRVLDAQNRYDDAMIVAKGLRWAVDNGARVVNLSLGGAGNSPALAAALDYAFVRDVVVIACTGNRGVSSSTDVWYPAREPGVVAVAGMDRDSDRLWADSITGSQTVLTAPATGLYGAGRDGGYWRVQGTSFAAPMVTASAALVRAKWPHMSAADVVNRLVRTARDLGPAGRDDTFGFGLVNPLAALSEQVEAVPLNPLDDNLSPGEAGFGPAPGVSAASGSGSHQTDQLKVAPPGGRIRWAAQPAGGLEGATGQSGVWVGSALLVAVLTGSALLVNRLQYAQAARNGLWRPRGRRDRVGTAPPPAPAPETGSGGAATSDSEPSSES
ncbi:type VII secretion-associated serine protease mycosin [Micromonospora pisi]|uniref:Type VII secretion-associated serine protease mycosin n=2 Tax=Micromonospora pisi TaxID=589240 RepID=A0A495JL04_9ACTN|nr:type VII secretion-associated serine protease mycosin [Micromonospora pisi]